MNLKTIQTRLETADKESISLILNEKALTIGANQTVDYIGLAIENIESANDRIDQVIKELQSVKKSNVSQIEIIKIGVSEWLSDNGIDKLQGDRISSISVFDKKESQELVIDNEEAVINSGHFKMSIDKASAKQALQNGLSVEGCHIEITHNEPSIRINKKRVKDEVQP